VCCTYVVATLLYEGLVGNGHYSTLHAELSTKHSRVLCGVQVISRETLEAMADAVPQALKVIVLQSIVLRSTA
jgi:hypothetical protein